MKQAADQIYEFADFRLDVAECLLLRRGEVVPITPKAFDVLVALVENSGRLLDKAELMKRLWPDTFVEEGTLARNVSDLRKSLGEGAAGRKFIETVPRRGYRFAAAVTRVRTERRSRPATAINSLAVLPFANASTDAQAEYLCDGITESIIHTLSQLPQLRVRPRSTVFRYKGKDVDPQRVGEELEVRAVLTGRILHLGERLVIRTELIDVADGWQLWGGQFDREPADILHVQEEIASEISNKLHLNLSRENKRLLVKRYTNNIEAYNLYLKGRYWYNKRAPEMIRRSIDFFEQAIEEDPYYALAYAGLADSYSMLAWVTAGIRSPHEVTPKAKAAARRALQIDDTLSEAHVAMATILKVFDWDWTEAENEYRRAIECNPAYATAHHMYGIFLSFMGRFEESIVQIRIALDLEPLSLNINTGLAWPLYFSRRYDEAIEQCGRALDLDPNFGQAHLTLGLSYLGMGRYQEAIEALREAHRLSRGATIDATALARAYVAAGRRTEAEAILAELEKVSTERYVSSFDLANVHMALGRTDDAFTWLEKAYAEGATGLILLNVLPFYDQTRRDPRFVSLLRRVGLEKAEEARLAGVSPTP
jgi:TolB-like protein/Tfp pilus assembly protein PilF